MTNPFSSYAFPSATGLANRKMPYRLLDTINVKDFGAVGDGVTDDWAAIMDALNWNSILVTAAQKAYSGTVRITALSWNAGAATATTGIPHGLTTGDEIIHFFTFSTNADWTGDFVVTVIDSTTFTYPLPTNPGPASADIGCFTAKILSATWSGDVVTVNFGAPHRLISGLSVNMFGFSFGDLTGKVITVTGPRQLTFPLTGSGAVTLHPFSWLAPPAKLTVVNWPGFPPTFPYAIYGMFMGEYYPPCLAGSYFHSGADVTGNVITFNSPFHWNEIEAGDNIRLVTALTGKVFFPAGTYYVSKQIQLPMVGSSGVFYGTGNSIIRGSFPDFIFSINQKAAGAGPVRFDNLTFINDDINGGGMRFVNNSGFFSGCKFTAGHICLTLASTDTRNSAAFDVVVTGCMFFATPGSTGSCGLAATANNGEYNGNYFEGLYSGIRCQNFCQNIDGSKFVNCGTGIAFGYDPEGIRSFMSSFSTRGNYFQNCGAAIDGYNYGSSRAEGNYIVGGANSVYGFFGQNFASSLLRGLHVTGQFSNTAVFPAPTLRYDSSLLIFRSVGGENSGSGTVWTMPISQSSVYMDNCNSPFIITYDRLNGRRITSATYDSGTGVATITTDSDHHFENHSQNISVTNVLVGGSANNSYNGIYEPITRSGNTFSYHVNFAPGTATANTGAMCGALRIGTGGPIKTMSWNTGTVTVETWAPHGIADYGTATIIAQVGGNTSNGYNGTFGVRVTDLTHFTYSVVSDPGTVDPLSLTTSMPSFQHSPSTYYLNTFDTRGTTFDSREGHSRINISDGQKYTGGFASIGDSIKGGGSPGQHMSVVWTKNGFIRRG
jgi:hypothetical protein